MQQRSGSSNGSATLVGQVRPFRNQPDWPSSAANSWPLSAANLSRRD